jgi:hypothetical protein
MMVLNRTLAILVLLATLLASTPAMARGGDLRGKDSLFAGDPAFATRMESLDGKRTFDLSESEGKPIVFVFGSYT